MPGMSVKTRLGATLLFLLGGRTALSGGSLNFRQALEAAVAWADASETAQLAGQAQLQLLEAMNRTRLELRPQLGLFSFSQPALLASSLGSWLTVRRPAAETTFALQAARLDLLAAELEGARVKLRTEAQVARRFAEALQWQRLATEICAGVEELNRRRPGIEKLVAVSRLTLVDRNSFDLELAERQLACSEAKAQQSLALKELAALAGLEPGAGDVRLEEPTLPDLGQDFEIAPAARLVQAALQWHSELGGLRERITEAARKVGEPSRLAPESLSAGYAWVSEAAGTMAPGSYLLGGHTLHGQIAWSFSPRASERDAWRQVLAAKLRGLEVRWQGMQKELRDEIERCRLLTLGARERFRITARQRELAFECRKLVETRLSYGIGDANALRDAERELARAHTAFIRAREQLRSQLFTLMALCGALESPQAQRELISVPVSPGGRSDVGAAPIQSGEVSGQ